MFFKILLILVWNGIEHTMLKTHVLIVPPKLRFGLKLRERLEAGAGGEIWGLEPYCPSPGPGLRGHILNGGHFDLCDTETTTQCSSNSASHIQSASPGRMRKR